MPGYYQWNSSLNCSYITWYILNSKFQAFIKQVANFQNIWWNFSPYLDWPPHCAWIHEVEEILKQHFQYFKFLVLHKFLILRFRCFASSWENINNEHQFFVMISYSSKLLKNKSEILKSARTASRDFTRKLLSFVNIILNECFKEFI